MITLTYEKLAELIEQYKNIKLVHDTPINITDLKIHVPTPSGDAIVNHFIKKCDLPIVELTIGERSFKCATTHILQQNGADIYAHELEAGESIETRSGDARINATSELGNADCYDISIPRPHLYYDTNGILHHNTLITAGLSSSIEKYGRSIVIVPNVSLVTQTEADYVNLGLDVGVFYGGRKEFNKTHTICTWQSLNALVKATKAGTAEITITEFLEDVVCVIVDECHGIKGPALKEMLAGIMSKIPLRWGLTGTIPKDKSDAMTLKVSIGEVVHHLAAKELQDEGVLSNCDIKIMQYQDHAEFRDYQSELKFLVSDDRRMNHIAQTINKIKTTGNTLVLVDRIEAGDKLKALLIDLAIDDGVEPDVVFVSGGTKMAERKEHYDDVTTSTNKIVIATYALAAVGINLPRLFNVVLLEPGKSFVRVIQSIGRGIRKAEGKDHVMIYDITSSCKFSKRHLTERKKFYKEVKYNFTVEKTTYK